MNVELERAQIETLLAVIKAIHDDPNLPAFMRLHNLTQTRLTLEDALLFDSHMQFPDGHREPDERD